MFMLDVFRSLTSCHICRVALIFSGLTSGWWPYLANYMLPLMVSPCHNHAVHRSVTDEDDVVDC